MRGILCKNKTAEERLAATNRLIKVTLLFVVLFAGTVLYDFISAALSDRAMINHLGQECSTLGILICALSINISDKKKLEAELAGDVEEK